MLEAVAYNVARRIHRDAKRRPTLGRRLRSMVRGLALPYLPYRRWCRSPRRFPAGVISVTGHSRVLCGPRPQAYLNIAGDIDGLLAHVPSFYLQEEFGPTLALGPNADRVYVRPARSPVRLPGAWVSICNPCSGNWMHWLSECVPALAAACDDPDLAECGIIHDADLHQSALDTLEILAGDRRLMAVQSGAAVTPEQLCALPGHVGGWSLAWPRADETRGSFSFAADALRLARKRILEHCAVKPTRRRRLFVIRRSTFRVMRGQDRLARVLEKDGFEAIEPGSMAVGEQVRAFSECDVVVAQAGAALGNIMFMPEGATVVCLHARSRFVNPEYFAAYGAAFGVGVRYVSGSIGDESRYDRRFIADARHPMNASFRVDPDDVRRAVQTPGGPALMADPPAVREG